MKKKKTVFVTVFVVFVLLLAGGYVWLRSDVPEMEFTYGEDQKYADWRMDKDGTVTVYGEGSLTWFSAEYSARLLKMIDQGSVYAFLKWHVCKAFEDFPAERIVIGKDVTDLMEGENSFHHCRHLSVIEVDGDNPYFSSRDGVLFDKTGTKLIQYPAKKWDSIYRIPDGVASVEHDAFRDVDGLGTVIFPDGLLAVEANAFDSCRSLSYVSFPDTLTKIGDQAFVGCRRLKWVYVPSGTREIGEYALGFYLGREGWAPVKGFTLMCAEDAEAAKSYAATYGTELEIHNYLVQAR